MTINYILLSEWFDEDDIDPVDFKCKDCGHSFEDHEEGNCDHGIIGKCKCEKFVLDKKQIEDVKEELTEIGEILLKNYKKAKRLDAGE